MSAASEGDYYVPHGTYWPIIGSIGLATIAIGFARFLHGSEITVMLVGIAILIFMLYGWLAR